MLAEPLRMPAEPRRMTMELWLISVEPWFIPKEPRQFAIIALVCIKTLPISLLSSLAYGFFRKSS
jgi:hypothetical protein